MRRLIVLSLLLGSSANAVFVCPAQEERNLYVCYGYEGYSNEMLHYDGLGYFGPLAADQSRTFTCYDSDQYQVALIYLESYREFEPVYRETTAVDCYPTQQADGSVWNRIAQLTCYLFWNCGLDWPQEYWIDQ